MNPIVAYLANRTLPPNAEEVERIKKTAKSFILYNRSCIKYLKLVLWGDV